jgi:hypothetical protein
MEIKTQAWVPEYMTLTDWADEVLDLMSERPVEITRAQAKDFCRAILREAPLRVPREKGRRIFRINGNDALVLDYAQRAPRSRPSWVKGRVHQDAFRIALRSRFRLELALTGWFERVSRWLRIGSLRRAEG